MKRLVKNMPALVITVMVLVPVLLAGALLSNDQSVEVKPLASAASLERSVNPSAQVRPTVIQPATAPPHTETTHKSQKSEPAAQHDIVNQDAQATQPAQLEPLQTVSTSAAIPVTAGTQDRAATYVPDVTFTLRTDVAEGKLVFIGVGGEIDGVANPQLHVEPNSVVQITLVNGDGAQHDWAVPELNAKTELITGQGASSTTVFRVGKDGEYTYLCTVPGHQAAGMEGMLHVGKGNVSDVPAMSSIARDPTDLPGPIRKRGPVTHDVILETTEVEARLADGTSYGFWTFDNKVPGPMLRVRVGDTVNLTLRNAEDSIMVHSIDLHAVNGPGGGASVTQITPGSNATFTFKALNPGLYVYHCATPMVAHHITNGMYGLILVEPEEGLPEVDREFYVMQGELYTDIDYGQRGHAEMNVEKLLDEVPEYFVFNGAAGALTEEYPMHAEVGDTVRIFFGVGGPNFTSSFHVIGEIFDRVFDQASLTSAPLTDVQTTLVPAGGATIVEFRIDVPGRYILVDHALSRAERGLVGFLEVTGTENPEVFRGTATAGSGH
jgi:nitrite reductase (NO-forming)